MRKPSLRNHRFQTALADAGLHCEELAKSAGVNMKSVQRWLYEGRVPRRKTALQVGQLLGVDPLWLWPTIGVAMSSADLVCVYTGVGDVPDGLWQQLSDTARSSVDITTGDVPALPGEGLAESLAQQVRAGVVVRLYVGRAASPPLLDGILPRRNDVLPRPEDHS